MLQLAVWGVTQNVNTIFTQLQNPEVRERESGKEEEGKRDNNGGKRAEEAIMQLSENSPSLHHKV